VFVACAILAAALFIRLGVWQLHRRGERRARNALVRARLDSAVVDVGALPRDTVRARFRRVRVAGRPFYDHELVLAARTHTGSPGINLITPFRFAGTDTVVIVNRGWIYSPDGMTADLSKWREADTVFSGYVEEFETGSPADSVRLNGIRRMNYAAIARVLPYPIRNFYVVATSDSTPAATPGVVRLRPPVLGDGPHLSYAVQWFAFACIAVVGAGIVAARSPRL